MKDGTASARATPASVAPLHGAPFFAGALAVLRREIVQYFDSKIAWVFTIAFLVLANSIFMNEFFLTGDVDMGAFFERMPLLLPLFLPALTMRLFSEERRTRTLELLLTLPLSSLQATLGKVLAALLVYLLFLAGTLPIVGMLEALGDPDLGQVFAGYLGLIAGGVFLIALGTFVSALSADQIVTFVTTAVVAYLLVLAGEPRVVAVIDGLAPSLAIGTHLRETLSPLPHLEAFARGVVALDAVVWFATTTALFLWLTALALARHRE